MTHSVADGVRYCTPIRTRQTKSRQSKRLIPQYYNGAGAAPPDLSVMVDLMRHFGR